VAGHGAAAEAEGQRQREDHAAQRDAEGDQDHFLADAQMGERGAGREQQHPPVHPAGEHAGLGQPCVDGGDQHRLAQEVGDEPADEQDQRGGEEGRQERDEQGRRSRGPGQGEGIDADAREEDEDPPEADQAQNLGWQAHDAGAAQGRRHPPALQQQVHAEGAGDPRHDGPSQPAQHESHHQERQQNQQSRDDGQEPLANLEQPRPHVPRPPVVHSRFRTDLTPGRMARKCVG
jgi:hypothetical protein